MTIWLTSQNKAMKLSLIGKVVMLLTPTRIEVAQLTLDLTDPHLEPINERTMQLHRIPEKKRNTYSNSWGSN